jgi:hypothetical protein
MKHILRKQVLFICGLFNVGLSSSGYGVKWQWLMNNEFEMISKKAVTTYYKVLSHCLPKRTKENHKDSLRVARLQAEILNQHLWNLKQEW